MGMLLVRPGDPALPRFDFKTPPPFFLAIIVGLLALDYAPGGAATRYPDSPFVDTRRIIEACGRPPLSFEPNKGQADEYLLRCGDLC